MSGVVLDSCTLLWLAAAPEQLSSRARAILADPQAVLLASSISTWEVAVKVRKGTLVLPSTPTLPHNDPMDYIIVATARSQASLLLTADCVLLDAVDFAVWRPAQM